MGVLFVFGVEVIYVCGCYVCFWFVSRMNCVYCWVCGFDEFISVDSVVVRIILCFMLFFVGCNLFCGLGFEFFGFGFC